MNVTVQHETAPAEPQFLLTWEQKRDSTGWLRAGAGSMAVHVLFGVVIVFLLQHPDLLTPPPPVETSVTVTPLVAPPSRITQRAPNLHEVSKEFKLESIPPHRNPTNSNSPGAAELPVQHVQKFKPPTPTRSPIPAPVLPDAPSITAAQSGISQGPPAELGTTRPISPPQINTEEKPKIAFEKPGTSTGVSGQQGLGRVPVPKNTVEEAIRSSARQGPHGIVVGDDDQSPTMPSLGSRASPMPGKLGSSIELMSDPMGVDFWPYLVRVLAAVRRNWYAVIPESARLGRTGRVIIQFAINRDGSVPKLVIAVPSGAEPLDRAAVAGVSASNPFPPLPAEFKGNQIRLQFAFTYSFSAR